MLEPGHEFQSPVCDGFPVLVFLAFAEPLRLFVDEAWRIDEGKGVVREGNDIVLLSKVGGIAKVGIW